MIEFIIDSIILLCTQSENKNDDLIALFKTNFPNRVEAVRGEIVVKEAIGIAE